MSDVKLLFPSLNNIELCSPMTRRHNAVILARYLACEIVQVCSRLPIEIMDAYDGDGRRAYVSRRVAVCIAN